MDLTPERALELARAEYHKQPAHGCDGQSLRHAEFHTVPLLDGSVLVDVTVHHAASYILGPDGSIEDHSS